MPKSLILGELEQLVLLAVLRAGERPAVRAIRDRLELATGHRISRGALYRTLDRLEGKGFVEWTVEDGGPARGGHARRRFSVTEAGLVALRSARAVLESLWGDLDEVSPSS